MPHWLLVLPLFGFALFIFLRWQIALPLCVVILGVSLGVYWKVIQAQRRRPVTGKRAMIGNRAVVVKAEGGEVEVDYEGEIWHAVSSQPLHQGQQVIIESVEGLILRVVPLKPRDDSTAESNPSGFSHEVWSLDQRRISYEWQCKSTTGNNCGCSRTSV